MNRSRILILPLLSVLVLTGAQASRLRLPQKATETVALQSSSHPEYLWYETENMRGISADARHEPVLNPSWMQLPAAKKPGRVNGRGFAEWCRAAGAHGTQSTRAPMGLGNHFAGIEVPRPANTNLVRYDDGANRMRASDQDRPAGSVGQQSSVKRGRLTTRSNDWQWRSPGMVRRQVAKVRDVSNEIQKAAKDRGKMTFSSKRALTFRRTKKA